MIDSQKRTEYYTRSKKEELSGSINGLSPIINGVKPRNGEVTHVHSIPEYSNILDKSWSVMSYQEYVQYRSEEVSLLDHSLFGSSYDSNYFDWDAASQHCTRSRPKSDVAERLNGGSVPEEDATNPGYIFKFYRKFGYYWNVFPKTDYCYLPGSKKYKAEITRGIPVVPNLSRSPLPTWTSRLSKSRESSHNSELSYEDTSRTSSAAYLRSDELIQSSNPPSGAAATDRHCSTEARWRTGQSAQSTNHGSGRSPLRLDTKEDRQNHINHLYWSQVERQTVVRRLRRLVVRTFRGTVTQVVALADLLPPRATQRFSAVFLLFLILPLLYYLLFGSDGDDGSGDGVGSGWWLGDWWWAGCTAAYTALSTATSSLLYISSLVTQALLYIPTLCLQLLGLLSTQTSATTTTTTSDSEMKTSSGLTLPTVLPPGGDLSKQQLSEEDLNQLESRILERIRTDPGFYSRSLEQKEFFQKMLKLEEEFQKINERLDGFGEDFFQNMLIMKEEAQKMNQRLESLAEKQITDDLQIINQKSLEKEFFQKMLKLEEEVQKINERLDGFGTARRNWSVGLEEKLGVQLTDLRMMIEAKLAQSQQLDVSAKLHSLPTERMVERVVARYHADRTGKPDYALQSAGGLVVRVRCTQTYTKAAGKVVMFGFPLWDVYNGPETILMPGVMPGECWAFEGSFAQVTIKLASRVRVTGFTLEHSPRELALHGHIASAPKDFSVWALEKENDERPFLLGEFTFQDGDSLQEFKAVNYDKGVELIDLKVVSNQGHPDYTCLYRFRVHGIPVD